MYFEKKKKKTLMEEWDRSFIHQAIIIINVFLIDGRNTECGMSELSLKMCSIARWQKQGLENHWCTCSRQNNNNNNKPKLGTKKTLHHLLVGWFWGYKNALGFALGSFWFLYRMANHTPIIWIETREVEKVLVIVQDDRDLKCHILPHISPFT